MKPGQLVMLVRRRSLSNVFVLKAQGVELTRLPLGCVGEVICQSSHPMLSETLYLVNWQGQEPTNCARWQLMLIDGDLSEEDSVKNKELENV